jgi:hypothetical protein
MAYVNRPQVIDPHGRESYATAEKVSMKRTNRSKDHEMFSN